MDFTNYNEVIKLCEKIGVGNKATCTLICHNKTCVILDARLTNEKSSWYICQDVADGASCDNKLGYKYSFIIDVVTIERGYFINLEPVEKTLYNLEIGDIIKIRDMECYRKVLSTLPSDAKNPLYILSSTSDTDENCDEFYMTVGSVRPASDLKQTDYILHTVTEKFETVNELTIAQIEEKLNITNLKIVD